MKTCQFCNAEISESVKFCNNCGKEVTEGQTDKQGKSKEETIENKPKQVEENQEKEIVEVAASENEQPSKEVPKVKKTSNKKTKAILFSSIAIIILFIGVIVFGKFQSSVDHLLKDFETAMKDKDTKALADMLTTDDKNLKITAESLEGLVQLYESQPSELTYLTNNLQMQSTDGGTYLRKMFPIDLVKDGKKFILYDNYKLLVNPVYIKVNTNYKDTDIIINDEVMETTDKDNFTGEVGPLIPGEYVVEAVYDTGFFHLTGEATVKANDPSFAQYADLYLEGSNVSFDISGNRYSDLKSIKLFVNGKDTGWNIAKEDRVGPLLTDGSMNVSFEADLPWGTVRTNDVSLDDTYFKFNLGNSDEFMELIMDKIILFNEEFVEAYAGADPEIITTATHDYLVATAEDIVVSVLSGAEYTGSYHGTDFYTDSFILTQDYDGLWKVSVDTITYFEEAVYEKDDKPKPEQIEEEIRYDFVYDKQSEEWLLYETDYAGLMEEDKMERHKVSEPVVHESDWKAVIKEIEELEDIEDL